MNTNKEEWVERLKDLTCINGAMYFGAVEEPCMGRETGECCQNEQTYDEAFSELTTFIREERAKEYGIGVDKGYTQGRENGRKEAIEDYLKQLREKVDGMSVEDKPTDYEIGYNTAKQKVLELINNNYYENRRHIKKHFRRIL